MRKQFYGAVCIAIGVVFGVAPHLAQADLDDALTEQGWEETLFDDKTANSFTTPPNDLGQGEGEGSQLALDITSMQSVSLAHRPVDIDLAAMPFFNWQWRAQNPDPNTDTTIKGGDDRTLAVYVAFPYQPDAVGFWETLQRPIVEALRGSDTPGRVLIYVWGGGAEVDNWFENPYTGHYSQMVIKQAPDSPLNTWHSHKVNVREDFINAFGFVPANPAYIAVGSDSDDTETTMQASVRGLKFSAD